MKVNKFICTLFLRQLYLCLQGILRKDETKIWFLDANQNFATKLLSINFISHKRLKINKIFTDTRFEVNNVLNKK